MRSLPPHRVAAVVALGFALWRGPSAYGLRSQEEPSAVAVLLSRARTLEQRGRLDLAKQDWTQVLLADPNDAEALAGLARAAKVEGRAGDAAMYAARLRAAHPNDPALAALEDGAGGRDTAGRDTAAELNEAARLARAGDAHGAMAIYRRVYGINPPPGAPALAYYEAEGATEEGRPAAIAGLRALADKFPADARYKVALGRLLLGSERTRAEGRTLLEEMPENAEAVAALRGGPGEREQDAAARSGAALSANAPLATHREAPAPALPVHPAPPVETARNSVAPHAQLSQSAGSVHPPVLRTASAQGSGIPGRRSTYAAEDQAAFAALDAHRVSEAEQGFRNVLTKDPTDSRALAGMGYLSVARGDMKSGVLFFERAQENGDRSLALTRALVNAQFELMLQQAAAARARGDMAGAEAEYRVALRERPSDPGALEGLAEILLQAGRTQEAIPVFTKLTQMRPMSPAAWRGLVLAEGAAGDTQAVVNTVARVPQAVSLPLQGDTAYELTVAAANRSGLRAQGTQVARVEPPAKPVPAPRPVPPKSSEQPPAIAKPQAPARSSEPPLMATVSPKPVPGAVPVVPRSVPAAPTTPVGSEAAAETIANERVQQANVALLHGNNAEAAALLRDALSKDPERADAWRGLVEALHKDGKNAEAVGVLARISSGAEPVLERDATFEATAGAVYLDADRPEEALRALARAQGIFASQRLAPPLELVLQIARLLAARGDDDNLYRELMYAGERQDLTAAQRQEVQMVWTGWAVRRARALAAGGDRRRAVVLLNAAAQAFSGNEKVVAAVADGYAGIGLPREAVALFKATDLSQAPAGEVELAVSAATTARDFRAAESWARLGLQRFGSDPEMLNVAAELEQARGHENRALSFTEQAKALAPAQDPGQVLAAELKESKAGQGWATEARVGGQLSVLLAPRDAAALVNGGQGARPTLPESADASATTRGGEQPPVLARYEEPSR